LPTFFKNKKRLQNKKNVKKRKNVTKMKKKRKKRFLHLCVQLLLPGCVHPYNQYRMLVVYCRPR